MDNHAFILDDEVEVVVPGKVSHNGTPPNGPLGSIYTVSTTRADEIRPINVNRPILYTEDVWGVRPSTSVATQTTPKTRYTSSHHGFCLADSVKKLSKRLLPPASPPTTNQNRYSRTCLGILQTFLPILYWVPNYNVKQDLLSDVVAGITVLALHIPQGLAYGKLAGVDPINGLYVSLFPVIIYAILGTSRQISIGTFAVISIACKDVIDGFDYGGEVVGIHNTNHTLNMTTNTIEATPIEILTTLCLFVGLIQLGVGLMQLGIMAIILPNALISGFVVACSIHVFTSQVFGFVGLDSRSKDLDIAIPFDLIKTWIKFFYQIPDTNLATLLLSIICMVILVSFKYWFEPYLVKKFKLKNVSIPIDILLIIFVTLFSWLMNFNGNYEIEIIPKIPKAFEDLPKVPRLDLMPRLIAPAVLISFVSYVSSYSLGKMYARTRNYEISANQELVAIGAANAISSFFLCYPCAASLSRSAVQEKVGGRTQLTTIVSSLFMVIFLLFLSPYLQTLPKCVLSCIIAVALISTMRQFREFFEAWKFSKLDGILWIVTFTFVVLFSIGHGLLYSVLFSFLILVVRLAYPIVNLKRQVSETEVFVEVNHTGETSFRDNFIKCSSSSHGWIVFEYQGPLIFINSVVFRNKFRQRVGRYVIEGAQAEKAALETVGKLDCSFGTNQKKKSPLEVGVSINEIEGERAVPRIHTIIFDCSRISYVDAKGADVLLETVAKMQQHGAQIVLTSLSESVYRNLLQVNFFDKFSSSQCFLSVVDAVTEAELHNNNNQPTNFNAAMHL